MSDDKTAQAIEALRGRDPAAYRKARADYFAAELGYREASKAIGALGKTHYRTLERHGRRTQPHGISGIATDSRANMRMAAAMLAMPTGARALFRVKFGRPGWQALQHAHAGAHPVQLVAARS